MADTIRCFDNTESSLPNPNEGILKALGETQAEQAQNTQRNLSFGFAWFERNVGASREKLSIDQVVLLRDLEAGLLTRNLNGLQQSVQKCSQIDDGHEVLLAFSLELDRTNVENAISGNKESGYTLHLFAPVPWAQRLAETKSASTLPSGTNYHHVWFRPDGTVECKVVGPQTERKMQVEEADSARRFGLGYKPFLPPIIEVIQKCGDTAWAQMLRPNEVDSQQNSLKTRTR